MPVSVTRIIKINVLHLKGVHSSHMYNNYNHFYPTIIHSQLEKFMNNQVLQLYSRYLG